MSGRLQTDHPVEEIAAAYLGSERSALAALNAAVRDALADLAEREHRLEQVSRLISKAKSAART